MRESEYTANQQLAEMLERLSNAETFRRDFEAEADKEKTEAA